MTPATRGAWERKTGLNVTTLVSVNGTLVRLPRPADLPDYLPIEYMIPPVLVGYDLRGWDLNLVAVHKQPIRDSISDGALKASSRTRLFVSGQSNPNEWGILVVMPLFERPGTLIAVPPGANGTAAQRLGKPRGIMFGVFPVARTIQVALSSLGSKQVAVSPNPWHPATSAHVPPICGARVSLTLVRCAAS